MGKLLFRFITTVFIMILIATIAILTFLYFTQYKPSISEHVNLRNPQQATLIPNHYYTLTTMNIGFGAMDASNTHDITYPALAGKRTDSQIHQNMNAIINSLVELDSDFYTLQEVDQAAARSQLINQSELISSKFEQHSAAFTYVYNSLYIPTPLNNPLGKLESGLLTLSRYKTDSEQRLALPRITDTISQFSSPHHAILETVLPVRGNKQLIIANLQLADYDAETAASPQQFSYLNNYILEHIKQQNYIILGGDWNHFITAPTFRASEPWPATIQPIPDEFKPASMSWAFNKSAPTSRSSLSPYEINVSFVSITDGFLVSNNIEVISTVTTQSQFLYSDHAPVTMTFILK